MKDRGRLIAPGSLRDELAAAVELTGGELTGGEPLAAMAARHGLRRVPRTRGWPPTCERSGSGGT